jgi:hypothetical protein
MAIGGRSVEELKQAISYPEFLLWDAYRQKRGTLNQGMRLEWLFARLSAQVHIATGGKEGFLDFLRYHEEPETSIDSVAKLMGVKQVTHHGK